MKAGDKFPVNLNEHIVAEAVVIDIEDGKVTLDIPATRIVMGVKSSLTDLPDTAPAVEHQILGAENTIEPPQAPKTTDESSNTQNSEGTQSVSVDVAASPTGVPPQPAEGKPVAVIPADAIGEGLASVPLKEMD